MKRLVFVLFLILLSCSIFALEDIYQRDQLEIELETRGAFTLKPTTAGAETNSVEAELFLVPQEDFRQKIISFQSGGSLQKQSLVFKWVKPKPEEYEFTYKTRIQTKNIRKQIKEKISYPIEQVSEYEDYLRPTKSIDSDNPLVIAKAQELAQGEDDLYAVVFKLARFVEENVKYDLNTLTAQASQKASWVLENKQGVCDEMTSLFIAMARSLGIPARFVKGVSFTTSELFEDNWPAHGWAEVYFPSEGWISFDITFGEYGYVDVTHIKLRESNDPTDVDTRYEWLGEHTNLETKPLQFKINIVHEGQVAPRDIDLEADLLSSSVDLGSYNLVKARVTNLLLSYNTAALNLAHPSEIKVIDRNRKIILLKPQQSKEVSWPIKVEDDLNPSYEFFFPLLIYSEKNYSAILEFSARKGEQKYTLSDLEKHITNSEEKGSSQFLTISCKNPPTTSQNTKLTITCTFTNKGTTDFSNLELCIHELCEKRNLASKEEVTLSTTIETTEAGFKTILVQAQGIDLEKKVPLQYEVLDSSQLSFNLTYPSSVVYGQSISLVVELVKISRRSPTNVSLSITGPGIYKSWSIESLEDPRKVILEVNDFPLTYNNSFTIRADWEDENSEKHTKEEIISIQGVPQSFWEKCKFLFNKLTQKLSA